MLGDINTESNSHFPKQEKIRVGIEKKNIRLHLSCVTWPTGTWGNRGLPHMQAYPWKKGKILELSRLNKGADYDYGVSTAKGPTTGQISPSRGGGSSRHGDLQLLLVTQKGNIFLNRRANKGEGKNGLKRGEEGKVGWREGGKQRGRKTRTVVVEPGAGSFNTPSLQEVHHSVCTPLPPLLHPCSSLFYQLLRHLHHGAALLPSWLLLWTHT